jgi:hypothetical protein
MNNRDQTAVKVIEQTAENFQESKDEEYAYWQSRTALERLVATQELSFAFFEERGNEVEVRRQFLRSAVCLQRP